MACSPFKYYSIFKDYGAKLNDLIVGPAYDPAIHLPNGIYNPLSTTYVSGDTRIFDGTDNPSPFRVFRNIDDLLAAPAECFYAEAEPRVRNPIKGLLVWDTQRYYSNNTIFPVSSSSSTGTWTDPVEGDAGSVSLSVGCFIIPSFGQVTIIPQIEYRQNITITFDSNSDPNFDLYGAMTMEYIDWFINANYLMVNRTDNYFELENSSTQLYIKLQSISEPIYSANSTFVRRAVTLTLRYCNCC